MVLYPEEFVVSRSLRKTLRNGPFATRVDRDFAATILACAEPRRSGPDTWLHEAMIDSYQRLHRLGFAHSVEAYVGEQLAGGADAILELPWVDFQFDGVYLNYGRREATAISPDNDQTLRTGALTGFAYYLTANFWITPGDL